MVTRTDIANRALQRVGGGRIAAGALFTEDSKNASEVAACYDIVRRAEMRRNVWRFATRKAILRAIDVTTMQVVFPLYNPATTYAAGAIVTDSSGMLWWSVVAGNVGNTPSDDVGAFWTRYFGQVVANSLADTGGGTTPLIGAFFAGELTYDAGNIVYMSLISTNTDTPPSANWLTLTGATVTPLVISYPIGAGPSSQSASWNVFRLPAGFLRDAPDNPSQGSYAALGAPVNVSYRDWVWEGPYILSQSAGPIILRFCADVGDPNLFDAMFVEGLGSRIATEVCEPITQSVSKLQAIAQEYKQFMTDARLVNGIEVGPSVMAEDSYIINRL